MSFKNWIKNHFRKSQRVYILPTKMGGYLNGLIFLMFLLAVGYSNNLLLIFTLFLFGFNLLWVIQTHAALNRLQLGHLELPDGHVGESVMLNLSWKNSFMDRAKIQLRLEGPQGEVSINTIQQTDTGFRGEMTLPARGRWQWQYLQVVSEYPFGLYQVWKFLPIAGASHAYPPLLKHTTLPDQMEQRQGEEGTSEKAGHEGVRELAPYILGEESRRISWKQYARSGELLIKAGEEASSKMLQINFNLPVNQSEKEAYLSLMATHLVLCYRQQIPFAFISPQLSVGPTFQSAHLAQCLKVMSLC